MSVWTEIGYCAILCHPGDSLMDEQPRLEERAAVSAGSDGDRTDRLREKVIATLERGDVAQAQALMRGARQGQSGMAIPETAEWAQIQDVSAWPDAWLIAALRSDLPDEAALDVLVERHWKRLFGRCQMLTLNAEEARDLAQEAWCRILKARQRLKVDGNFPGYLISIATNLWRDSLRFDKRAGPMARHRLAPLDAPLSGSDEDTVQLADVLPRSEEHTSELQSQSNLVCRLLLEKKKQKKK